MDLIGTTMGFVTIPMALLTLGSIGAGVLLLMGGFAQPVLLGLLMFGMCMILAPLLERAVVAIDDLAILSVEKRGRRIARMIAIVSGALPMIVILGWEYTVFHFVLGASDDAPKGLLWLWSYGIATGPWTLFAQRVSRFRRTLCGIRAYAGHLAYWLFSLLTLAFDAPPAIGLATMMLPAILPFIVGLLLALADRDALTNVRV